MKNLVIFTSKNDAVNFSIKYCILNNCSGLTQYWWPIISNNNKSRWACIVDPNQLLTEDKSMLSIIRDNDSEWESNKIVD